MAPRAPKTAAAAAGDYRFPTMADLIAEAAKVTDDLEPYQLPLSDKHIVTVPKPDGDTYLSVLAAQRRGAEDLMLQLLIPDAGDHAAVRLAMKGAPMRVADAIIGNILSYYYGTGLLTEAAEGNSPAS
jgi:hypothetical protein